MNQYKVDFENLEWRDLGDSIREKRLKRDGAVVRLVEFGREMKHPDWCPKGHCGYVVEGTLELRFSDTVDTFGPGDVFWVPDGDAHRHRPKVLSDRVIFFSVERA